MTVHDDAPSSGRRFKAELVRVHSRQIDIKLVVDGRMHLLAWRRRLLLDEVLVDGVRQQSSRGLWGREMVYGLVFGRDRYGEGGERLMLSVDWADDWTGEGKVRGVRLESSDAPLLAYGSLQPHRFQEPASFGDWLRKSLGIAFRS